MFTIEEFKKFVESIIPQYKEYKTSIKRNNLIESLLQFELHPSEYLNVTRVAFNEKIRKIISFDKKPKTVQLQDYLLYLYKCKYCYFCQSVKLHDEFWNDKTRWDNKSCKCIECKKIYNNMPEIKNNFNKSVEKYRLNNLDKDAAVSAKRRAIKKSVSTTNINELQKISDLYTESKKLTTELKIAHCVNHFIPLALGGTHEYKNLRIITNKENLLKSSKHPLDFYGEEKYKEILKELNKRL